ncbi:ATP-binding cassette domain-containing protein [Antarcticimicrobium luteum]|uniref:ATP-binding cassette domain-containing protein n=1 Tax=Antarcticimicrobium luteum TaxID=2547397 RepID=A0A4R5VDG7_9RHOB|nr:ATP-binding cassette domain-containing protein [Antarcticimicrobium luteum]TDK49805.1 ATP-binding cassette domain-containing protein [Antarcticimicrobium luteum]
MRRRRQGHRHGARHFKLVPAFTVLENILLFNPGPFARIARQAVELADRMGFDLDLAAPVGTLGVSEQQRLEILKVLVAGARIVILDEPTAVLGEDDGRALMHLVQMIQAIFIICVAASEFFLTYRLNWRSAA